MGKGKEEEGKERRKEKRKEEGERGEEEERVEGEARKSAWGRGWDNSGRRKMERREVEVGDMCFTRLNIIIHAPSAVLKFLMHELALMALM